MGVTMPAYAVDANIKDIPVLNTTDWRTGNGEIPWSTPVLVRDEFDGDYLAVFDRNFQGGKNYGKETGVVTNWSRHYLRLYSYDAVSQCSFFVCREVGRTERETTDVSVKVGDNVFRLEGKNGNYKIDEDLAHALKTAPSGQAKIKFMFEGSGFSVVSDIGAKTVDAWKTVYQDAVIPTKSAEQSK